MRKRLDQRGVQYGPAFTGLAAVHTGDGSDRAPYWPRSRYPARSVRSRTPTAYTRRCWMPAFQSVAAHPAGRRPCRRRLASAAGCPSTARLRCCPQRPLLLHTGDESRHLRGRGRPRGARRPRRRAAHRAGVEIGHRRSDSARRSGAGERLLTIEWQHRRCRSPRYRPRTWLLISITRLRRLAAALIYALKNHGSHCTMLRHRTLTPDLGQPNSFGNHLLAVGFCVVVF